MSIDQTVYKKAVEFEKNLLQKHKTALLENLIKPKISNIAQLVFVFNNAVFGISLGKLVSAVIIEDVHLGLFKTILYSIIGLVSSRYLWAYWKKEKNKERVKKEILSFKTIKNLKQYIDILPGKFKYGFLFLHNEKIPEYKKKISIIENDQIKDFLNNINKEELYLIKEALKKHSMDNGFTIDIIDEIKKVCNATKKERIKEEKFLNNLKTLTDIETEEEDDLISAMTDQYIEPVPDKKKEKINFKKIL